MKKIYVNDNGKKVSVIVTDEVEQALKDTRRAIWRGDAKERYYCEVSLDAMTDKDERTANSDLNPETILIKRETQAERTAKLIAALQSLTAEQMRLVKMLRRGMSVTEIAAVLGVGKTAVSNMRIRIQEKIKKYLD